MLLLDQHPCMSGTNDLDEDHTTETARATPTPITSADEEKIPWTAPAWTAAQQGQIRELIIRWQTDAPLLLADVVQLVRQDTGQPWSRKWIAGYVLDEYLTLFESKSSSWVEMCETYRPFLLTWLLRECVVPKELLTFDSKDKSPGCEVHVRDHRLISKDAKEAK